MELHDKLFAVKFQDENLVVKEFDMYYPSELKLKNYLEKQLDYVVLSIVEKEVK